MAGTADTLSQNCRNILNNAEHLAVQNESPFVGTEHVLKSLLTMESRIISWLVNQPVGLNKDQAERQVDEMIKLTRSAGSPNFYSPSLERFLAIGGAIWGEHKLPTEGLVIGALLAHKEVKNAMGSILIDTAGGKNILALLLDTLPFAKSRIELIPPNNFVTFDFTWNPETIPQSKESVNKFKAAKPPLVTITPEILEMDKPPVKGTHWVVPGRLLCGRSPGDMTAQELVDIVEAGVDTFVSLQEDYREYGCKDYRLGLQTLARNPSKRFKSFPPHEVSFLHCPIPDFGVLSDRDFIAFISELKRSLEDGRTLYIHCYGGHGRTGTVVLNLLEMVYGVDRRKAMEMLRGYHQMRGCGHCALNRGKLEGEDQTRQAERMEPVMYTRAKKIG
eukprot:TRINITY_DN19870_c0_g1_i1.p1 TRINITY_DN19870_c0_g1~~TRINITY_DN19870_c0_g1_i1.p1  ORF type:complete len:445 (+),score=76.31 TRINITY_DN19870_c0_g1_i1:168-1337(+)